MEIIASYRVSQRQNHFTSHQQEEIKKLNKEGKRVIKLKDEVILINRPFNPSLKNF